MLIALDALRLAVLGTHREAWTSLVALLQATVDAIRKPLALTHAGRTDRRRLKEARLLFEEMLGYANHLGLYAEQTGPHGEALGNFPQAFTASNIALECDPAAARVTLDAVIRSMWQTALDMSNKYKETSEGGLALQIPVSNIEC